ncbi:DUF4150 domain-containing protein [Massilia antarctica]|uniref:DUF4150 domain-containing protein n=1 Tax=Massilia antarctica TaxID=2765360 RepID=A0AA48WAJ2_9BURK|nr:DUF4150 domain-containing protein [Massilia antarctica]QPI48867.1 DUF4150 domain-containing protein [Massilia antarctica]
MGKIGARKNSILKAVSTAPSFNKTPVGSSTPPVPYPTTQDLSNSVSVASTVRFNGDPAYVLDSTQQPSCKGDDAGLAKGVRSNTVNGYVKPTGAAAHFRAEKKFVVRQGDTNVMNGGNNPGIYVTAQVPSPPGSAATAGDADEPSPAIEAETPAEQAFLECQPPLSLPTPEAFSNTAALMSLALKAKKSTTSPAPSVRFVPGKKG